ncbi:unnamed protein product [Pylaiella littoralis]
MEVGATVPQTECPSLDGEGMPPHSWSRVDAAKFFVRHGPNYPKHKKKDRSQGGSFYELKAMDWLNKSSHKVDGVAKLATASGLPEAEFSHPSVPSLLVVNVQLPMEAPKVFKGALLDGPTLHAVFYFTLKEDTAKALQDLDSAEPSVRLLAEYFRRAESEPAMRSRFKAIAVVNNQEAINMARLINPFNGKPVLITESGSLMRGTRKPGAGGHGEGASAPLPGIENSSEGATDSGSSGIDGGDGSCSGSASSFRADDFLELDIHVRRWNFMARKGLNKLSPKFSVINVSVAFLVEGRGDAELPEQILGCATLNCFDIAKARDIST